MGPKPDFTGYVTRYGRRCSDGRTIAAPAFKDNDGQKIPLVWQHQHNSPNNVLGHLALTHRDDGVYAEAYFNDTEYGTQAKALVQHGDIKALSIFANRLVQNGPTVMHGNICEGSLVLAGANPGAYIDNVTIAHGDETHTLDSEAVIYTDDEIVLEHAAGSTTVDGPKKVIPGKNGDMPKPSASNPDPDHDGDNDLFDPKDGGLGPNATVEDVMNTLTPQQKDVVYGLTWVLLPAARQPRATAPTRPAPSLHDKNQKGDDPVTRNVFDKSGDGGNQAPGSTLTHDDIKSIFAEAKKGGSLKDAVEQHCLAHGINDISTLFPYDQAVTDTPEFISRRMEWVQGVLSSVRKTPFSRIRSWTADITLDEARAKGYVKGELKKEEYFAVARRITTPQTIYKKQKLDRDDILDITDFDVVAWLQTEMRLMLDEELARAILVGDGRGVDDPDKINATNVRPIVGDDPLYVSDLYVDLTDSSSSADEIVDAVVEGFRFYRGTGTPTMDTTLPYMSKMLLAKDTLGRRLYATKVELAAAMGVADIIPCEALEATSDLIGVIVNLQDYTIGADKGGEVSMFDFFDIDYNQFKYLMETRVSGAMTKYKGALVVWEFTGVGGMLLNPTPPTFVSSTGVVTIPTFTHATYVVVDDTDGTEGSALDRWRADRDRRGRHGAYPRQGRVHLPLRGRRDRGLDLHPRRQLR